MTEKKPSVEATIKKYPSKKQKEVFSGRENPDHITWRKWEIEAL